METKLHQGPPRLSYTLQTTRGKSYVRKFRENKAHFLIQWPLDASSVRWQSLPCDQRTWLGQNSVIDLLDLVPVAIGQIFVERRKGEHCNSIFFRVSKSFFQQTFRHIQAHSGTRQDECCDHAWGWAQQKWGYRRRCGRSGVQGQMWKAS